MHAGTEYTTKPNQAQINFARTAIDFGADMVIGHHPHWVQEIERYCPNNATILGSTSPIYGKEARREVNCDNPKYIFYSLGNFIFDQMWGQETREGLALKVQVSKNVGAGFQPALSGTVANRPLQGSRIPPTLDSIELIPIIIDNYSTPRPANKEESKKILEKIRIKENILR